MKTIIAALIPVITKSQTDESTSDSIVTTTVSETPQDQTTSNQIADFIADSVTMNSVWGEVFDTEASESGSTESVILYFSFTTGGVRWNNDTFIQNYISIEDPDI